MRSSWWGPDTENRHTALWVWAKGCVKHAHTQERPGVSRRERVTSIEGIGPQLPGTKPRCHAGHESFEMRLARRAEDNGKGNLKRYAAKIEMKKPQYRNYTN